VTSERLCTFLAQRIQNEGIMGTVCVHVVSLNLTLIHIGQILYQKLRTLHEFFKKGSSTKYLEYKI